MKRPKYDDALEYLSLMRSDKPPMEVGFFGLSSLSIGAAECAIAFLWDVTLTKLHLDVARHEIKAKRRLERGPGPRPKRPKPERKNDWPLKERTEGDLSGWTKVIEDNARRADGDEHD